MESSLILTWSGNGIVIADRKRNEVAARMDFGGRLKNIPPATDTNEVRGTTLKAFVGGDRGRVRSNLAAGGDIRRGQEGIAFLVACIHAQCRSDSALRGLGYCRLFTAMLGCVNYDLLGFCFLFFCFLGLWGLGVPFVPLN